MFAYFVRIRYTTICGTFEKARKLYPDAPAGAYALAMIVALGGSLHRYLERKLGGRNLHIKTEWGRPTGAFEKSVGVVLMYALLRRLVGVRRARLTVVLSLCGLELLSEMAEIQGEPTPRPIVDAVRAIGRHLRSTAKALGLGGFYRSTQGRRLRCD